MRNPEITAIIRKWVKDGYAPLEVKVYKGRSKKYWWIWAAYREKWRQEDIEFMKKAIFGDFEKK